MIGSWSTKWAKLVLMCTVVACAPSSAFAREEPRHRYQLGFRLALGGGSNGIYVLTQLEAGYRVLPVLLVGGSLEKSLSSIPSSGDACLEAYPRQDCPPDYLAVGPRLEFQPFPRWIVRPWAGAGLGVAVLWAPNRKPAAMESTFDLGLDVRPSENFAIGPYLAAKWFLTNPYEKDPSDYSGGRVGVGSLGVRLSGGF